MGYVEVIGHSTYNIPLALVILVGAQFGLDVLKKYVIGKQLDKEV